MKSITYQPWSCQYHYQ